MAGDRKLNLRVSYPRDDKYDYFVKLAKINLDKECQKDLSNHHGFIIKEPQAINKTIKSIDGIFSTRFGRGLSDEKPLSHMFSCKYGCTQGKFFAVPHDANWVCPICHTEVKAVGNDYQYFGYIVLKPDYCIIHPAMYQDLVSLIGKDNLENIIEPNIELDGNGKPMTNYDKRLLKRKKARRFKKKTSVDETYMGIGMLGFRDKFQEIIDYFFKKKPAKKDIYEDIMKHKDIVFTHSIPVYTTQLRIAKVENKRFTFEKTNAEFNLLAKLAAIINRDNLSIYRNRKYQNQILWDMQDHYNNLTEEIVKILSDKKGVMRSTISGRVAFSERTIIVPDKTLRCDEISLPYYGLVILMEQVIINIIQSSYNISYAAAYKIWYYATLHIDQRVLDIINNLIKADKVHCLINRNPTIFYQSLVWKRVVKCNTDSMVMGMENFTTPGLCADYDGDTLNIKFIYNKAFDEACQRIYNPRNAFFISRDDGKFNTMTNLSKDTLINLNGLLNLNKKKYSEEQKNRIKALKEKYKDCV